MSLNYEKHGNVLFVTADNKYDKLLQKLDSTWDEERKVWITSKDNETIIQKLQKEILKPGMNTISNQSKYKKEIDYDTVRSSSDEEEEKDVRSRRLNYKEDSSSSEEEEEDIETKKYLQRRKQYEEILEKKKHIDNKSKYKNSLKTLSPPSREKITKNSLKLSRSSSGSSRNSFSSSSRSGSSSDDFPSPETPKRRVSYMKNNTKDYDAIVDKIHNLQKEVISLKKKIK